MSKIFEISLVHYECDYSPFTDVFVRACEKLYET